MNVAGDEQSRAQTSCELAERRIRAGELDRADQVLTEVEADESLPSWLQIRVRLCRARLVGERESLGSARTMIEAAIELARASGSPRELLDGLCLRANIELGLDLQATAKTAAEAEQLANELDRPLEGAAAKRIRALALRNSVGESEVADRLRSEAFHTLTALGQSPLNIEIDQALDLRHVVPEHRRRELCGRFDALEISLEDIELRARLCMDLQGADAKLEELLAWAESRGARRSEAAIRRMLAATLFNQGHHGAALEQLRRALASAEALGDRSGLARCHAIALSNTRMLDRDQRAEHLERALAEARALGDRQIMGVALSNAASILADEGAHEQARGLAIEARTHAAAVEDLWRLGYSEAGLCVTSTNRAEQRAHYRAARDAFERFGLDDRAIGAIVRLRVPFRIWAIVALVVILGYYVYLFSK